MRVAVPAAAMSLGMTAVGAAADAPDLPLLPMRASATARPGSFSFERADISANHAGSYCNEPEIRAVVADAREPLDPAAAGA